MDKITTPEFRVSFPNVFKPRAFEGQEPKYSIVMLFDKKQDLGKLKAFAAKCIEEKWPDKSKRNGLRNPFRDGDAEREGDENYAGKIFINASSKIKPGILDEKGNKIVTSEEFYGGCYAIASLTCYAYDKAGNKGVAFGLQNIMKKRDGEPFSGRSSAEDDFKNEITTDITEVNSDDMFK